LDDSQPAPISVDQRLLDELIVLRSTVLAEGEARRRELSAPADPTLDNLASYLALRRHDLRDLQRQLMWRGLSSLWRLEGRVLPALDATIAALAGLAGVRSPVARPSESDFFDGEATLRERSIGLFGPPAPNRATRIMVTLPGDAAVDADLVEDYVQAGMDVARINCAHDDAVAWRAMAENVRHAAAAAGRHVPILMDIAGPKIRTADVAGPDRRMRTGDELTLVAAAPSPMASDRFVATVTPFEILNRLELGETVLYNDGRLEAVVDARDNRSVRLRVVRTRPGGVRLKPEKGLNLPGTSLGLIPLTSKDEADIATLVQCADIIGYSFLSRPEDIDVLESVLAAHGGNAGLGLIAKIERPEAVHNLPMLIARAAGRRPFGVMIARGDLAVELGYERLAEMQEEILWLCEAASVPVVWATQVLEGLVADGIPTRAEMTDAAMSVRAECVMLNKGPYLVHAIEMMSRLLGRMDDHFAKKTSMLRALRSW